MFKKFDTKTLAIAFVVLLAIVALIKLFDWKKGEKTIKDVLAEFDIENVTSVDVITRADTDGILNLLKTGEQWQVRQNGKTYNADEARVNNILNELLNMKPKRLAATQNDKWAAFEVTDSSSIRVIVKNKDKILSDVYIGKFSYQQPTNQYPANPYGRQQGTMTTYIRLEGEKEVYAVDGFLRMTFNSDLDGYRNNKILQGNKENWTKLTFTYPADSSFTLTKQNDQWMVNGLLADSAKVVNYLSSISNTTSTNFIEDSLVVFTNPTHTLKIEGNNMAPLIVSALPGNVDISHIITSSINQGTYFNGSNGNVFTKIFKGENDFFTD